MALADQHAEPLIPGAIGMTDDDIHTYLSELPQWHIHDTMLERDYEFPDFNSAIAFVNRIAGIAEAENHHPDICVAYNHVRLQLTTHKIGRLSKNDFIVAAKADRILQTRADDFGHQH